MNRRTFLTGMAGATASLMLNRSLRAGTPGKKKLVFFLFDGCRQDTFDRLCNEGKMPTLARLRDQGLWADSGISVFPSTTGPAYAPFIDGLYPATSGLAGIRQYDRKSGTYRIYCGIDSGKIKDDMNPDFPTIFELLPPEDSLSVFGIVDRGAKHTSRPLWDFLRDKLSGDFLKMDVHSFEAFYKLAKKGLPAFSFVTFHAPDSVGHAEGVDGERYSRSLVQLDALTEQWLKSLEKSGELENIVLVISADHGLDSTSKHGDMAKLLRKKLNLVVQDAMKMNSLIFNADKKYHSVHQEAIISISGNACAQIYLKGRGGAKSTEDAKFSVRPTLEEIRAYRGNDGKLRGDLIKTLFEEPCVGFIAARDGQGRYRIFSRTGESEILRDKNDLSYRVLSGEDPFQFKYARSLADGRMLPERRWLRATCGEKFPDAVFQMAQLLEAENSGDLIINATPGYEPWTEGQNGVHGGLDKGQIQVPILLWGQGIPKARRVPCARTVDLFPTFLNLLGVGIPKGIPGISII